MSNKKYNAEDIKSAHDKQMRRHRGEGGVIFSPIEKEILDNHIVCPSEESENN